MEEQFSGTERYQAIGITADELEDLEKPEVPGALRHKVVSCEEWYSWKPLSRANRCAEACQRLNAIIMAVEGDEDPDVADFRKELREHVDVAENCEFPSW